MDISRETTRILIAEDAPEILHILRQMLSPHYTVLLAKSGGQALELVGMEQAPDLILLDVVMPGMDGFEACRRIKNIRSRADIPIIFLTAKTDSASIVRGFELGAADYVTKPFSEPELLARVRAHVELKRSRDLIAAQNVEQKELIHILSHDLTNTFTAISGIIEFMKAGCGDPRDLVGELEVVNRNGIDLIGLVRQMRRLGEKPIEVRSVNLGAALAESLRILARPTAEKNVTIDAQVDGGLQVMAETTSFVNSVLNNVLTNAVKFSQPGSTVHVRAVAEQEWVRVSVRDHGIGMPASLLRDLFDVSKRTNRSGTRGERGTGFGMPLLHKFVKSYGGTVEVTSSEEAPGGGDHGTEVTLRLRDGRGRRAAAPPAPGPRPEGGR